MEGIIIMSKQLIGMFDPFDENGDFDAEKIVYYIKIKETVKEEETNNSDSD